MVKKCCHDNCVEGRKLLYIRIHFLSLEREFLGLLTLLPVVLLCQKVQSAAMCNGVRLLSDVSTHQLKKIVLKTYMDV